MHISYWFVFNLVFVWYAKMRSSTYIYFIYLFDETIGVRPPIRGIVLSCRIVSKCMYLASAGLHLLVQGFVKRLSLSNLHQLANKILCT